jgi:hypothetical protein
LKTRLALIVACLVACLAGGASTANAAVSIPSFGVSLSGAQAGSSPDVAVAATIATSSGDALKDALISLPPGLLVNPTAASVCQTADFQAGNCPSSSQIGDGTVSATEVVVGGVQLPVQIYLISPQGPELARIGLIGTLSGAPVILGSAPVTFRSGASTGLDIVLTGIPNQMAGLPAHIDALSLRLFGTVNGNAFTRLPTSCGPAQIFFAIDSYQVAPNAATSASSFAPVGCSSLPYQPQLTLGASIDPGDNGVGFKASFTQAPSEAASSSIALLLPSGLAPNRSALSSGCAASDVSTCPAIGTATASTPLLPSPVVGRLVLAGGSALYAVFPPPLGLTLPGTASISGNAMQLTFSGLPDVPFTGLEFNLNGGSGSIITVGSGLCSGPQTVGGQLVGQSGATIPVNAGVGVGGCRSFGSGASRPSASRASLSGFASGHPKLHFLASNVTTISIGLPRGLSFSLRKRGGMSLSGAKLKQLKISQGRLLITLRSSAAQVGVTITAPLLRESAGFQRKVRGHQIKSSVVGLKLTGLGGQTSLPVKLKVK